MWTYSTTEDPEMCSDYDPRYTVAQTPVLTANYILVTVLVCIVISWLVPTPACVEGEMVIESLLILVN